VLGYSEGIILKCSLVKYDEIAKIGFMPLRTGISGVPVNSVMKIKCW
jgi:hypothetical protein